MSPFNYAKVNSENDHDESLEQQQTYRGLDRLAIWLKTVEKFQFLRWPLTLFLLLVILICELSILHKQPSSLQLGEELNRLVPRFATEQRIFHSDQRYASDHKTITSINATKQHWRDLMPKGGGFLNVPDYSSHTLPPPMHFLQTPDKDVYAIAVFHELHCLMHMSGYIDKLVMKIRNKDFTLDEGEIGHNDHCFNYLRNALMCCGDTTLEGQSQAPMFKNVSGTDGTGAVHICRNYDEITVWAEGRRITDAKESL
ncbi:uncharacterized protein K460DRAFT_275988 [Cucurbitaria berberidis CBS 394.84]|uniref:Uncharacterized protein n=1 Tax=Cucurbitaria berberidis CBS 394.84 TaxID=1168544 RepID=A0A9P4GMH4_9PLEO|nr:uncharacterized protein K460DRAFT_275988 [Cucurbitaria berberidis CBS 394.84]KAF1847750.1 hypothetical protein K460DRAFT_275988 [Cucurbitaria berberidis CBS 394.84]